MTTEKEITELIQWAKSQGATVTHETEEESGRLWTVSVQVSNLKGCGPYPMSAIGFAERMREIRGKSYRIGSVVRAKGWRGEWEIIEYDASARRPYCLRSLAKDDDAARFPCSFGSLAPAGPVTIWETLENISAN